jgi:hypothetical protein
MTVASASSAALWGSMIVASASSAALWGCCCPCFSLFMILISQSHPIYLKL